jgi:hypothetical protein
MKYLSNIDLVKNELQNAKIHILASDPGTPAEGQIYYNSTSKVLSFYNGTSFLYLGRLDQTSAPTGSVSMNSQKITNLGTPTAATDAATMAYVDASRAGLTWKTAVRAATTAAGTLATSFENADTIDSITLVTGDRILIKNQVAPADNGIYTVNASGAPTRATDFDAWTEVAGAAVFVMEGATLADTQWVCTSDLGGTLNTTAITFTQFGAAVGVSDGDKGDIVVSGTGTIWNFDSAVVTTAAKTVLDDTTVAAMVDTLGGASSTGSTGLVRQTTPTLITPVLGVATATSVNKITITQPATGATLTIPDGVTLTGPAVSGTAMTLGNNETVAGLKTFNDGSIKLSGASSGTTTLKAAAAAGIGVATLPTGSTTLASLDGVETFTNKTLTAPTLTTPALGTPASGVLTNCTGLPIGGGGTGQTTGYAALDALSIHGADVASATTTNLETATGFLVDVTGTTTITGITLSEGHSRVVRFTGILTLTHGSSLILPGAASITTAAGDFAIFVGYAAGVVRCLSYEPLGVVAPTRLGTGASISTKYLRGDSTWQTIGGGGDALTSGTLAQFAATTSLELKNLITNETGSGALVFADTPTLVTPILGVASATSLATSAATPLLLTNGQLVNVALTSQTVGATTLTIPDFASVVDEFTFKTKAQTMSNKTFVAPALGTPASGVLTNCTGLPIGGGGTGQTTGYAAYDALTLHGADVTISAGTLNLDTATGVVVVCTNSSALNTVTLSDGRIRIVKFTGTPTISHSSSLILPGGANITAVAGDVAVFVGLGSSVTQCVSYSTATVTGTGGSVKATSPTLVTPTLGVASATSLATSAATPLLLTNGQLVNIALTSQTTGATTLTIPDFASVVDEFTFKTQSQTMSNKTFVAPVLGAATATTINKVTLTQPTSGSTLTIPDGVTLTGPASSGTAMTLGNVETVTGAKTFGDAGAVGKLKVAGTTSGSTIIDATAAAGAGTVTLPLSGQIPAKYSVDIGDGATTAIVVTHSLSTRDVVVSVHNASTFEEVICDVSKTSTSTITLTFAVAPTTNQYRATVIG